MAWVKFMHILSLMTSRYLKLLCEKQKGKAELGIGNNRIKITTVSRTTDGWMLIIELNYNINSRTKAVNKHGTEAE